MRLNKLMLGVSAGVSLFVGFVIVSVAVGAIFPSMHTFAAPLICSGEVKVESIRYSYKPGQVGWDNHIYCIERGKQREITFPAIGVTGLIASAILFVFLIFVMRKSFVPREIFGEPVTDLNSKKTGKSGSGKQ